MREVKDIEQIKNQNSFRASEMQELTELSEIISYDSLRYERLLEAEEEIYEF